MILIDYTVGTEIRHFRFGFDVLSTKLNYHEHWRKIIEDIESEYRMLSLDYMKRTFHGFSPDTEGETPELIWWSIFAGEQKKFVNAVKSIIERPRQPSPSRTIWPNTERNQHTYTGWSNKCRATTPRKTVFSNTHWVK